ncbi:MAG TPA: PAS domain-containing sensor histidine kinase [Gemmatimonadaceae bacterium]|nr:PAS domain-containing sensor histidine kinase [Gemmatimonadaceae bacterium]
MTSKPPAPSHDSSPPEVPAIDWRPELLDHLRDGIVVFDREWRYVYVNDAAASLLERPREALLGRVIWEVFPTAREGAGYAAAERAVRERRPVSLDTRLTGADRWVRATHYPLPAHLGTHFRDVTAEKAAEVARDEALALEHRAREAAEAAFRSVEAANQAKTEFLAVMSHELRTPLTAIQGYAQLLELGIHGPVSEQQRETLARIQAAQRHLMGLINDVLHHARLEAGRVQLDITDVPLAALLGAVEAVVTPQAQGKGIALEVVRCDPALAVRADRAKLMQVLVNLLANAVKFTDADGAVRVSCEAARTRVHVHVRDTGVGIPAEMLDAVFEPFVQVDKRLSRRHEGVGLGLAISRDLARRMGGELTVASELGVGSTFTLTIPRSSEERRQRRSDRRSGGDRRSGDERRSGRDRRERE